jgi:hypothetical protein
MISGEFKKEEYWLIKWPLCSLVLSILFAGGLVFGLNTLDAAATTELRRARASLDQARQDVDEIEEEEQTIIEYIGRYRVMEEDSVFLPEDRLQFQERLNEIRSANELWPVPFKIEAQMHLPLQYKEGSTEPGEEIVLNTSLVELSLPLLHEDDLSRLLASLMDGPGVLQPLSCSLTANNKDISDFIYLVKNFNAECSLALYTFQLPPEPHQAGGARIPGLPASGDFTQ